MIGKITEMAAIENEKNIHIIFHFRNAKVKLIVFN